MSSKFRILPSFLLPKVSTVTIIYIISLLFYTITYADLQPNRGNVAKELTFSDEILSKTQDISDQVMSPYCPGRTLSSCPSNDARMLRTEISTWLQRGYSEQAVIRQLKGMYGSSIIGKPETTGFGIIAWSAPFLIIGIFLILIIGILIKLRHSTFNSAPKVSELTKTKLPESVQNELDKRLNK